MSPAEEQHVRDVLTFFFPGNPPARVSDELAELAAQMLDEAMKASKALDFVPRPPGTPPGMVWLLSQAVQMAWRRQGKQRIYEMVRKTVANRYRSEYTIAKNSA
jgi:hypothetical protein